ELLIVDDCSKDNTLEILKNYSSQDHRIKYSTLEENSGPAVARNQAIDMANGSYIAFLDSDDLWFENKLEKQLIFMQKNDYNFTCTIYTKIDENSQSLNQTINTIECRDYWGLLKNCPGNSTVIYNAEKLGKFKTPDIKKRNDYVMWLQIIKKEKFLYGIPEPLSSHRVHSEGISSNKADLIKYHWTIYRDIERLSVFQSVYLMFYWVSKTLLKNNKS